MEEHAARAARPGISPSARTSIRRTSTVQADPVRLKQILDDLVG